MTRLLIRAMPEREDFVAYLQKHLPDAEFVFDQKHNGMDTWFRALEAAGDDPVVHMEEDIILTRDFRAKLEAEIAAKPDVVIQFFSMRKADLTVGSRWDGNYLMLQCTYFPAGYSRMVREFADTPWKGKEKHFMPMDTLICEFLKARREKYWIHVPSLVEHRQCVSMVDKRRSSKRQSLTFRDPLE